jgi:hypothetical protein
MTQTTPPTIAQAFISGGLAAQKAINAILIVKSETGWNARYGGPHAATAKILFGRDTLPTVFTPEAAPETVMAFVRERHPGCYVALVDTKWQRLCR